MFFSKMTLCHKNDRGVYIYMLKNKLIYVPQKIFQQILPTKATNTPNYQLPINYYDPEGNMVGTYSGINLAANETITHHQLKRFINTHLPENYEVFPYFAYPKENITCENLPDEIMIAVRLSN